MRILRSSAALLAFFGVVLFVGCQSAEQKEKIKGEQDKLQGKWKIASREGEDVNPEDEDAPEKKPDAGLVYHIEGDIMKHVSDGVAYRWYKITLSPDKDPKQIDLLEVDEKGNRITDRVSTGKKKKGKATTKTVEYRQVGIYKLDGDTLKLALSYDTKKRPTAFDSAGRGQYVLTLKKAKDAAGGDKKEEDKGKKEEDKGKKDEGKEKKDEGKEKKEEKND